MLMLALLLRASHALPQTFATALVLIASFVNGMGGALLWSAQGSLVILESTAGSGGRQAGDFWALFHASTIIGNAYAFLSFSLGASVRAHIGSRLGCTPHPLSVAPVVVVTFSACAACSPLRHLLRGRPLGRRPAALRCLD